MKTVSQIYFFIKNPLKEVPGLDTLHGGYDGYDQRHWEVLSYLSNSVTFGLKDSNGTEGFPGTVFTQVSLISFSEPDSL